MLLMFATLAVLAFCISVGVAGVALLRRARGAWRAAGAVLLAQALLAAAALVALSTIPFGIGEPLIRVPFRDILIQALGSAVAVGGVAGLVYLIARHASAWQAQAHGRGAANRRLAAAGLLLAVPLVAAGSMAGLVRASTPERERERDPNKRPITLSPGFASNVFVQGTMDNPTTIVFGPDDKLYIADISGAIWAAEDANQDGVAETIKQFADGFSLLVGLAWHEGELYTASSGKIEALRDSDGDGLADQRRLVVGDLPSLVLKPHSNNGLAFGADGRLYFGVGSTTEGQIEDNPLAAAILSVKPDGSDLKVFARGLGNTFDVAFNSSGALFGGDNSPGGEENGEDPADEFNYLIEGEHYGYPYFYGDPPKSNGTRGALVTFPPHSSPTGVSFYSGDTYPALYRDNAFITLWNRGELARIELARTAGGDYLARTTTFGKGFLYPIDTVTGPDGNLYVADFGTSAVYRITYDASQAP
ncbi:MAG TPA: PQQ-dependent sugar dehydrogenase [Roseiflexaceae bacterium]|nr:PQQ-dependent sugar dehydrogenase [Roseiflexaceae bacterium]